MPAMGQRVLDFDPGGSLIPALRVVVKGDMVESAPVAFADDQYHHLAVTYDDGDKE